MGLVPRGNESETSSSHFSLWTGDAVTQLHFRHRLHLLPPPPSPLPLGLPQGRRRAMSRLWKWYQRCLTMHPVKTQIVSSGILWGMGDIAAQTINHSTAPRSADNAEADRDFKINWRRVAISSMFGFAFVGPVGHHWYEHLDRFIILRLQLKPKSVKFVATKVAADGLIFGPLDLLIYLSYIGLASGKSMPQVKDDLKRDFLPGFVVGGGVWPIVQVANFRFVPVRYQLLYVNIFCLLDSSFLSWLEQQGDASWKQWLTSSLGLENHKSRG